MVLRILCIGDVGNVVKTISRFSKSAIHIIVWPKADAWIYTYDDEYEIFQNYKVADQVKKINSINSPTVRTTVQPHNMYMLILAQLGILGISILAWIFYQQFKIALTSKVQLVQHVGVAIPILFLIIMWSDSYLLGHYTGNLFILFSSFIYSRH